MELGRTTPVPISEMAQKLLTEKSVGLPCRAHPGVNCESTVSQLCVNCESTVSSSSVNWVSTGSRMIVRTRSGT